MRTSREIETFREAAQPWPGDVVGRATGRYPIVVFDDAGLHLLDAIGPDSAGLARERWGWADVRLEVDFEREVPKGAPVVIRSRVPKLGRTSVTHAHVMHSAANDRRRVVGHGALQPEGEEGGHVAGGGAGAGGSISLATTKLCVRAEALVGYIGERRDTK